MREDEYGRAYRRNGRQKIITVPNDSPMTPKTGALPMSTQSHDSPAITRQAPVLGKPVPSPVTLERQTKNNYTHSYYNQLEIWASS